MSALKRIPAPGVAPFASRSRRSRWRTLAKLAAMSVIVSVLGSVGLMVFFVATELRDDWHTARDLEWVAKHEDAVK